MWVLSDVDECKTKTVNGAQMHACLPNTTCVNLPGAYRCHCQAGYHGDGRKQCTGTANLYPFKMCDYDADVKKALICYR